MGVIRPTNTHCVNFFSNDEIRCIITIEGRIKDFVFQKVII